MGDGQVSDACETSQVVGLIGGVVVVLGVVHVLWRGRIRYRNFFSNRLPVSERGWTIYNLALGIAWIVIGAVMLVIALVRAA
jgi:hypothetical protein